MENNFKASILLAEDDENLGVLLLEYLRVKGYETDLFADGESAFKGFQARSYDICILDVMMPKKDGFTLAKEMRHVNNIIPIIFLTAKSQKEDIAEGFNSGADDYMTKPFSIEELLLRVEAVLRRTKGGTDQSQDEFDIGIYRFNSTKQILVRGNIEQKLTAKESELLKFLCFNRNAILDRNFALRTIWNDDSYFNARSMDVYITKLRKYMKDDPSIQIINVRGKGFKLIAD
ncbi:MAG: response regulator transcription factor [Prevotellaceae bacterium]|jgi:DNA-binding response OmpR family regulator|nr:response regulator transcription factor [Prevotellaceae bacterium]